MTQFPGISGERKEKIPDELPVFQLKGYGEKDVLTWISEVEKAHGTPAIFIHLHPDCMECQGSDIHFTESNRQLMQSVFLAAKYLKDPLNRAARLGRAAFMTMVRMDGQFGMAEGSNFDPISGGFFGLVKSLNLEWEPVFCRAVDISPDLSDAATADALLDELTDPNRVIVETSRNLEGRWTLMIQDPDLGE